MKRPRSPTEPPQDPVLAQLDALINGPSPPPLLSPQPPDLPPRDPVLAQLDALISGSSSNTVAVSAPPRLCVPLPAPPPIAKEEPYTRPTGPPGLLREFGGVRAYMRQLNIQEPKAHDAQAGARLGPEPVAPRKP